MSSDAALIEVIVSRVLKELGTATIAARSPALSPPPVVADATPHESSIAAHVVTWEILAGLAGGVRAIRVGPKAILTPSARDYIRQHGLMVSRETTAAHHQAQTRWQIAVSRTTPQGTGALDALRSAGVEFERCLLGTAQESASHATTVLCRGEAAGVVVLSDQPDLVACLANRNERVRGAVLNDAPRLERLWQSFQPNLLAVDPLDKSQFELRQLLKMIVTGGANVARES